MNIRNFCITLPESPQRREAAHKHFEEKGLRDVTFFDGIHAEKFGLATEHTYDRDNPGTNFRMGYKCTGIWLSHYMLWGALNLLWDSHFHCFEDDVLIPDNWKERLDQALRDVPEDFDGLYTGSCCCKGQQMKHVKGDIYEVPMPLCTHAILWSKKALPVLLETNRKCYGPIDIQITLHSIPMMKGKVYTVLPRIFEQFNTHIEP